MDVRSYQKAIEKLSRTSNGYECGWVPPDPAEVLRTLRTKNAYLASDTEAGSYRGPIPTNSFLWDVVRRCTGALLPGLSQGRVGSCVGFGTGRGTSYSAIYQYRPTVWIPLAEESIYGPSRVEINGGRSPYRGDGSNGVWAAKAVERYGVLRRQTYQGIDGKVYDLSRYSEERIRNWGWYGMPDPLEPSAKQFLVTGIALVRNWEEAKRMLASGYGIAVCSSQGFTMTRDQDGFASAWGIWHHCLCLAGYQLGRREGGRLDNSWGLNSHTGPVGAGNPGPEGFWADANVLDRMLRQGDSWAFSAIQDGTFKSRVELVV